MTVDGESVCGPFDHVCVTLNVGKRGETLGTIEGNDVSVDNILFFGVTEELAEEDSEAEGKALIDIVFVESGDGDAAERVDVNVSVDVLVPLALKVAGHVFASVAVDVSDKIVVRVTDDDADDDTLAEREAVLEREAERLRIDNAEDVLENVPKAIEAVPQSDELMLIWEVEVCNAVGLDDSDIFDDTLAVLSKTVIVALAEGEGVPDGENEPV